MELDELKAAWRALDARGDTGDTALLRVMRATLRERTRSQLRMLGTGQVVQAVIGALLALLGGSYWVDHWGAPHLVACGMAVHLYGIALLALAIVQIVRWRAIDYGAPVADVQAGIARLRVSRLRAERVLLVLGAVMWVPLGLIALRMLGWDAWRTAPAMVLLNLGAGGVLAAGLAFAMHRWPQVFERFLAGGALDAAERELADSV